MAKLVTIHDENSICLKQKALPIELTDIGLIEAQSIADQLLEAAMPIMPIAGLAAPQIGISKQVFIYSFDRTGYNMAVAINPEITKYGEEKISRWEGCLSGVNSNGAIMAAYLERPYYIEAEYFDLQGQKIKKSFEGFAARLFQHEYDHLQGIVNVHKEEAKLQEFANKESLFEFIGSLGENNDYIQPKEL